MARRGGGGSGIRQQRGRAAPVEPEYYSDYDEELGEFRDGPGGGGGGGASTYSATSQRSRPPPDPQIALLNSSVIHVHKPDWNYSPPAKPKFKRTITQTRGGTLQHDLSAALERDPFRTVVDPQVHLKAHANDNRYEHLRELVAEAEARRAKHAAERSGWNPSPPPRRKYESEHTHTHDGTALTRLYINGLAERALERYDPPVPPSPPKVSPPLSPELKYGRFPEPAEKWSPRSPSHRRRDESPDSNSSYGRRSSSPKVVAPSALAGVSPRSSAGGRRASSASPGSGGRRASGGAGGGGRSGGALSPSAYRPKATENSGSGGRRASAGGGGGEGGDYRRGSLGGGESGGGYRSNY